MNLRKMRSIGIFAAVLALMTGAVLAAGEHYAVAVGGSNIYILGQGTSWKTYKMTTDGTDYSAVTAKGQYIYAADRVANRIDVYKVNNMGAISDIDFVQHIALPSSMNSLNSVAFDSAGGLFVTGGLSTDGIDSYSTFAYITNPNSASYGISSFSLPNMATQGMVTLGSNAFILYQDVTSGQVAGRSGVAVSNGAGEWTADILGDKNRYPQAIASNSGSDRVYVINRVGNDTTEGSISTYSPIGGPVSGSTSILSGMIPANLAGFTIGGSTSYLGVIGNVGTTQQLWKLPVDPTSGVASGSPNQTFSLSADDYSQKHFATISSDNEIFWLVNSKTSSKAGSILALDTSGSWTSLSGYDRFAMDDVVAGISDIEYVTPEPSSLATLAVFGAGAIGMLRRRRA